MSALHKAPPPPANDVFTSEPPRFVSITVQKSVAPSPAPRSMWAALILVFILCSGAAGAAFGFLQHSMKAEKETSAPLPVIVNMAPPPPISVTPEIAPAIVLPVQAAIELPVPNPEKAALALPDPVASEPDEDETAPAPPKPDLRITLTETPATDTEKARSLLESGHDEAALTLYEHILKKDSANRVAIDGKAFILSHQDTPETLAALASMANLWPTDAIVQAAFAKVLIRRGYPQQALPHLDRAAREAPGNKAYRLDLATLYDKLGHAENALTLYQRHNRPHRPPQPRGVFSGDDEQLPARALNISL